MNLLHRVPLQRRGTGLTHYLGTQQPAVCAERPASRLLPWAQFSPLRFVFRVRPSTAIALSAAALSLQFASLAPAHAAEPTPLTVRIAVAGPHSGPAAHLGRDSLNGAQLAIDDLNAAALRIGGRSLRWQLQAEDDQADPKQAVLVAQKLCDQRVHAVIGHQFSGTSLAAARSYAECGLPQLAPVATAPRLTQLGHPHLYRLIAHDDWTGTALADWAADQGLKRLVVLDDRTAYGEGVARAFAQRAQQRGLQVLAHLYTSDKAVDFSALLTEAKALRPQALFYGGVDAQAGPLLRQMQALGMAGLPVLGGDGLCTEQVAALAGSASALAGLVCAEGGHAVESSPAGRAWKQRYDQAFAGAFQGGAPYAYDAVRVVAAAMQRAQSVDPAVYAPALRQTNWSGLTGRIQFDGRGDLRHPAVRLSHYPQGQKRAWVKAP